jgi:hypothetical protein
MPTNGTTWNSTVRNTDQSLVGDTVYRPSGGVQGSLTVDGATQSIECHDIQRCSGGTLRLVGYGPEVYARVEFPTPVRGATHAVSFCENVATLAIFTNEERNERRD